MAFEIVIAATDSAWVAKKNPGTAVQSNELKVGYVYRSAIRFGDGLPLNGKIIKSGILQLHLNQAKSGGAILPYRTFDSLPKNLSAITFSDMDSSSTTNIFYTQHIQTGTVNVDINFDIKPDGNYTLTTEDIIWDGIAITSQTSPSELIFASSCTATPPKLILQCDYGQFFPYCNQPKNNIFVDKTMPVSFNWGCSTQGEFTFGAVHQTWAKLQWKKQGETAVTEVAMGTDAQHTFSPNTFPAGTLEWRVKVKLDEIPTELPWSDWATFTTTDSLSTTEIISPTTTYLSGNEPNLFQWKHSIGTGTAQTKAELQTSTDGTTWAALAMCTGPEQQYIVPANTLTGGSLYWRARTYNTDNVAGAWSKAAPIMVYAAPRPPNLSTQGTSPRLVLQWQSAEQQAYQLKAGDWTGKTVFGSAKQQAIPRWLPDGNITIGARVQSTIGLWSDWALTNVTIANVPQAAVQLYTHAVKNGASLTWDGTHEQYIIYRDGIPICGTTQHSFIDWLAVGKHKYQVRGVNGNYYALSNTATEITSCQSGVISDIVKIDWLPLAYRQDSPPTHSDSAAKPVNLVYCIGRNKPIAEISEHQSREHHFEYSFKDYNDGDKLRGLLGKTVIFKDNKNSLAVGTITGIDSSRDSAGENVSFTLAETDKREATEDYY